MGARLAQDRPAVVERDDFGAHIDKLGLDRNVHSTVLQLVRLGRIQATRRFGRGSPATLRLSSLWRPKPRHGIRGYLDRRNLDPIRS